MKDWTRKLDAFLQFNEQNILNHSGKISHELAMSMVEKEFEIFSKMQEINYLSDFDKIIRRT